MGAALRAMPCGTPTWVGVELALHGLADALQLHRLQRLVHVQEGGQAAQRVLHQVGHFADVEELQQLRVHGGEGAQEHGLQERNAGQLWHALRNGLWDIREARHRGSGVD